MADESARLLGFAFASADLLFELDPSGAVSYALGAAKQVAGLELSALTNTSWRAFVCDEDAPMVTAFLAGLGLGDRRGPLRIGLKPTPGRRLKRYAALCACRLPQLDPHISCALTIHALAAPTVEAAGANGLHTAEGLGAVTESALRHAAQTGAELNMELVELAGLKQAADALGHTEAAAALAQVAATLRAESVDGSSAARLDDDRFAFVRARAEPSERVAARITRAISDLGLPSIKPTLDSLELNPEGPGEGLRVLRVALDRFMAGGAAGMAGGSLSGMVQKTMTEATQFKSNVAERRFALAYQPVVSLQTGATDHYEVLVRLGDNASPAESILMAEGMEIIQDLDMAVIQTVVAELKKPARSTLRLAANLSARSLMLPAFTAKLLSLIKANAAACSRLTLEITESAVIGDLAAADAMVRRLRKEGCRVALDDFGAGAASFDYLRAIAVDEVKIDGRYIRELTSAQSRNSVVVRHLTDLCRDLKVSTVAEMVETDETAEILRQMGVNFGQGFLFGKPAPEPKPAPIRGAAPAASRRVGAVEGWN